MHPSWSRKRRWTEFVCVESGLVVRIPRATLGVSTDLLSTPNSDLFSIGGAGGGGEKIVSCGGGGGGSFQLRLDSTVFSCNGLWNIALVEWAPFLLRQCKDANQHLGVWNVGISGLLKVIVCLGCFSRVFGLWLDR